MNAPMLPWIDRFNDAALPSSFHLNEHRHQPHVPNGSFYAKLMGILGWDLVTWLNRCWWPRLSRARANEDCEAIEAVLRLAGVWESNGRPMFAAERIVVEYLAAGMEGVASDIETRARYRRKRKKR